MAMLRAGAYSQKFQNLERERVKHIKEQEKTSKGKAQLYSKQTAQRQKALEDKKKAMVEAEENRRKKALEERREAQAVATKRFRSALGRMRAGSKGPVVKKSTQNALEFYLPNKPKSKPVTAQPQKVAENSRIAFGKDVELKTTINGFHPVPANYKPVNGLQQRTPSLDDVLQQMRGPSNGLTKEASEPGRVIVHQRIPVSYVQDHSMGKRSSSDPSLNHPMNQSNSSLSSHATSNLHNQHCSDAVLQTNGVRVEQDLRITSPDTVSNSSNESLSSNTLEDSLNDIATFSIGEEPIDNNKPAEPLNTQQPIYMCEGDDSYSIDSLEEPRAIRAIHASQESLKPAQVDLQNTKPKVVGILKKSNSSSSMTSSSTKDSEAKPKRVRFSERLHTSNIEVQKRQPPISTNSEQIDSAHMELWKRVLPNGFTTQYLPNSAFTPKMKVSLNSKSQATKQGNGNGITVHIPMASADTSPLSPHASPTKITSRKPVDNSSEVTQPKVHSPSTGLNGHTNPVTSEHPQQVSLDKTPTDDDINNLWAQIRSALEDNQKIFVPPQVYNFRVQPSSSSTTGYASSQAQTAMYRDDQRAAPKRITSAERFYSRPESNQKGASNRQGHLSRPMRCQSNFSPQSAMRKSHSQSNTHPNGAVVQMTPTEPDVRPPHNTGRKAPTALSLEEKRLTVSIDNLNHKIKDHMMKHPSITKFQNPSSPDSPEFAPEYYPPHPATQMTRVVPHNYELPRSRARRNPKTAAMASAVNPQAGELSRARGKNQRLLFYN